VAFCDGLLTHLVSMPRPSAARVRIGHVPCGSECSKESVVRRLWYRDSYGRWHEDRHSEGRSGMPARFFVTRPMVLAGIVVVASLLH
jgi:hypothetical protein